jgi:serine/threonine protein phosphatase PrpC
MALQAMHYQVSVTCLSDIGLIRQNNEDALKLLKDEQFYVIADGMGGHQAGEVASREAIERLCALFQQRFDFSQKDITHAEELIKGMIQEVNGMVYRISRESPELRGMVTTLCCIYLHPEGLIYGHVGDSRIYRLRKEKLELLTQDHSLLRELIDQGQLTEEQAGDFLYKNIITRAIGTEPYVEPSVAHSSLEPGDKIILCTDGLTDLLSFDEIQETILKNPDEDVVKLLVKKAKQKGGNDNITVILVDVISIPASS